jgi:sec-independent protein translocase protein TatC
MPLSNKKNPYDEYPDDIFKDSRMSFGDHLEELRTRMIRALKFLLFFLVLGFILDGIGQFLDDPRIGIGKPMLKVITDPVEEQVRDFYNRRIEKVAADKLGSQFADNSSSADIEAIKAKLKENDYNLTSLNAEERRKLLGAPEEMPVIVPTDAFVPAFGNPKEGAPKELGMKLQVYPGYITYLDTKGQGLLESKKYLGTLSVQEGFVVYFKVSLLCGVVLASPFILYQFWAFVGAGLYPHEKRHVTVFLWPSVGLFLGGLLLCQFLVLPGAVKALLSFNEWLGFDPDIRLKEWLGLAIILPLVFGISFQTPLVMVFLNRIGMFTAEDYFAKWRHACMILAVFAAVVTPTPDAITMLYLFVPMFGLYLAGIVFCYLFPAKTEDDVAAEEAVEVAV